MALDLTPPQKKRAVPDPSSPPLDVGEFGDLPDLTPQQLHFVECLLQGLTASDAYRTAYDTSKMGVRTVWSEASRLRHHPHVAMWLRAAKVAKLGKAALTKDEHMLELDRLKEIALEAGDIRSAVGAEHLRGKAAGLYVERIESTRTDPAAILREIAALDPETARLLARRFNLALPSVSIDGHANAITDQSSPEPDPTANPIDTPTDLDP